MRVVAKAVNSSYLLYNAGESAGVLFFRPKPRLRHLFNMGYRIVPYRNEYQCEVASLIVGIQAKEFGVPITLEDQPDLVDVDGFYRQGKGDFWVAVNDDHVVGTISLKDIGNGQGALRKMFVHPDYRGRDKGVASGLLNYLLAESRRRGFKDIFLGTTDAFKAAHRFYEKNGFERVAPENLPVTFPRMKQDTRYYRLSL
jgi:N-acetylglutamate synthase-like GNAT family acetyltransferase